MHPDSTARKPWHFHLRAWKEWRFNEHIGLYLFRVDPENHRNFEVATGFTWEKGREQDDINPPAFLRLTQHDGQAQALMDSLWECGIRPTEGQGSAGSLAATKYHLEDMRRLVFKGDPSKETA